MSAVGRVVGALAGIAVVVGGSVAAAQADQGPAGTRDWPAGQVEPAVAPDAGPAADAGTAPVTEAQPAAPAPADGGPCVETLPTDTPVVENPDGSFSAEPTLPLCTAGSGAAPVSDETTGQPGGAMIETVDPETGAVTVTYLGDPAAIEAYWTPERMASAQPVDVLVP